jgi:hypothetical protein
MKYRIVRTYTDDRRSGRGYLQLEAGAEFAWLETHDYDTWDECEELATLFSDFEAAILLLTFRAHDIQRIYDYEAIRQ